MGVTIWHNPGCGTSRSVLAAIRAAGIAPRVVEYLKTPPNRDELQTVLSRAGMRPRDLLRRKEPLVAELGLDATGTTDVQILNAMLDHPRLIERPVVITPMAVMLCRPADRVKALLAT